MFKETLEADVKILAKYSRYIVSQDPIVSDIPVTKKLHSGGVIYKSNEKEMEIPLGIMSAEVSITIDDVYDFNLEKNLYRYLRLCPELSQGHDQNYVFDSYSGD